MDRILADDFVLVLADRAPCTRRRSFLEEARSKSITWGRAAGDRRITESARVGRYAVVTAKLRVKGPREGKRSIRTLWFSDTVRAHRVGWRYVFGAQALALPRALSPA
jgi:hypothetical protein